MEFSIPSFAFLRLPCLLIGGLEDEDETVLIDISNLTLVASLISYQDICRLRNVMIFKALCLQRKRWVFYFSPVLIFISFIITCSSSLTICSPENNYLIPSYFYHGHVVFIYVFVFSNTFRG